MAIVQINDIKIGKRNRKEMGDINSLAESIKRLGLFHPVVLTPDNHLIAGRRRIEAYKLAVVARKRIREALSEN